MAFQFHIAKGLGNKYPITQAHQVANEKQQNAREKEARSMNGHVCSFQSHEGKSTEKNNADRQE